MSVANTHAQARRRTVLLSGLAVATVVAAMALAILLASSVDAAGGEGDKRDVQPGAPPAYIPADMRAKMLAQQPLLGAASKIRWAVERRHPVGFTGIALRNGRVEVSWKGPPPRPIAKVIRRARLTAPVRLKAARYSSAELKRAASRIVKQTGSTGPVHTVEILGDGSGLTVAVNPDADSTLVPTAPVPVKVVRKERINLAASRLDDTPPFWGGARIVNLRDSSECTSGFGVKDANGETWLLTAAHCARVGDGYTNGHRRFYMGMASYRKFADDLLLIHSAAGGRMYVTDGPFTPWPPPDVPLPGVLEYSIPVAGWNWPVDGELLCHSGSVSGTTCGIKNTTTQMSTREFNESCNCLEWINNLEVADRIDGRPAAFNGDSGGPVFSLYFSTRAGAWRAVAKGTITGAAGAFGGVQTKLVYQDFGTAWREWGINPIWQP